MACFCFSIILYLAAFICAHVGRVCPVMRLAMPVRVVCLHMPVPGQVNGWVIAYVCHVGSGLLLSVLAVCRSAGNITCGLDLSGGDVICTTMFQ